MAARAARATSNHSEAFAEAYRELRSDPSVQFELPTYQPPRTPDWLQQLFGWLGEAGPLFRILFWGLLAALVLFLLYLIFRRLSGADWPWRRRQQAEPLENLQPEERAARRLLSDADSLAEQGRYSEAARLLLFRSIEDIDDRRPKLVRPALTSRDIAALDAIPAGPRGAFARLVQAVERSLFGRRPLGAEEWRQCRSAYEEFAFAEGWRR